MTEIKNQIEIDALEENLPMVSEFVESSLEAAECPLKTRMQISLAVEEIYINVAKYAYAPGTGTVKVIAELSDDMSSASITFIDNGIRYDPLAKDDPDVTLSAEERAIGGLGIFMTKKIMDDLSYRYDNGQNIFKMTKKLR